MGLQETLYQETLRRSGIPEDKELTTADRVRLLQVAEDVLASRAQRSNTLSRTMSAEQIARLRAQVDGAKKLSDLYLGLERIASDDRTNMLDNVTSLEKELLKASTDLGIARSAIVPNALGKMEAGYATGGPSGAWNALVDYIGDQGSYMNDMQLYATIDRMASDKRFQDFLNKEAWDEGDVQGAMAPLGQLAPDLARQVENRIETALAAKSQHNLAVEQVDRARQAVAGAARALSNESIPPDQIRQAQETALSALASVRSASPQLFDAAKAQQRLQDYEREDASLAKLDDLYNKIMAQASSDGGEGRTTDVLARMFADPAFRQWAADAGFDHIGIGHPDGTYIQGRQDWRALYAYRREALRGNYDSSFRPHQTGDTIRVKVGEGKAEPLLAAGPRRGSDGTLSGSYFVDSAGSVFLADFAEGTVIPVTDPDEVARRRQAAATANRTLITAGGQLATPQDLLGDGVKSVSSDDSRVVKATEAASAPRYITTERLRTNPKDLAERGNVVAYTDPVTGEVAFAEPTDVEVLASETGASLRQDTFNLRRGEGAEAAQARAAALDEDPAARQRAANSPGGFQINESATEPTATERARADAAERAIEDSPPSPPPVGPRSSRDPEVERTRTADAAVSSAGDDMAGESGAEGSSPEQLARLKERLDRLKAQYRELELAGKADEARALFSQIGVLDRRVRNMQREVGVDAAAPSAAEASLPDAPPSSTAPSLPPASVPSTELPRQTTEEEDKRLAKAIEEDNTRASPPRPETRFLLRGRTVISYQPSMGLVEREDLPEGFATPEGVLYDTEALQWLIQQNVTPDMLTPVPLPKEARRGLAARFDEYPRASSSPPSAPAEPIEEAPAPEPAPAPAPQATTDTVAGLKLVRYTGPDGQPASTVFRYHPGRQVYQSWDLKPEQLDALVAARDDRDAILSWVTSNLRGVPPKIEDPAEIEAANPDMARLLGVPPKEERDRLKAEDDRINALAAEPEPEPAPEPSGSPRSGARDPMAGGEESLWQSVEPPGPPKPSAATGAPAPADPPAPAEEDSEKPEEGEDQKRKQREALAGLFDFLPSNRRSAGARTR